MSIIFYLLLAACRGVSTQATLPATNNNPSSPATVVSSVSVPLGNAALWHQAVTLDASSNITGSHSSESFYSLIASWQSFENGSNSYLAGSSVGSGSYWSQILQNLQIYPTRFNQAQASDPQKTTSMILKQSRAQCSKVSF